VGRDRFSARAPSAAMPSPRRRAGKMIAEDTERWAKVIRALNIKAD